MTTPKFGFSLFIISLLSCALILSVYIITSTRKAKTSLASCIENSSRCSYEEDISSVERCISGKYVEVEKCNYETKCYQSPDSARCL
jgi:hypothetical protein